MDRWRLSPPVGGRIVRSSLIRSNPVPTIGGAIASGEPLMVAGAFDQRETAAVFGASEPGRALADRPDVLVFQTPPLASPLEVTGPIKAGSGCRHRRWTPTSSSSSLTSIPPSADYPQGYAMNLTPWSCCVYGSAIPSSSRC
jgi:hypothetical protein